MTKRENLLKREEVLDFVIEEDMAELFGLIEDVHRIGSERVHEVTQLITAILKGDVDLEMMPMFFQKAFGKNETEAKRMASDVAGYRFLPLEAYVPEVRNLIVQWGGEISRYPAIRVERQELKPEYVAEKVLEDNGVELPDRLKKRYLYLAEQLLSGERDEQWFVAFASRDVAIGGLELPVEVSKRVLNALLGEQQESKKLFGSEKNKVTEQREESRTLTQEQIDAVARELDRQIEEGRREAERRRAPKELHAIMPAQSPKVRQISEISEEELLKMERSLESLSIEESPTVKGVVIMKGAPISVGGDLISDEEKAELDQFTVERRPKVKLTETQEKELDSLWSLFKSKRVSRMAMQDFAKTYLVGMRDDRQIEGLMRDRYRFNQDEVDHAMRVFRMVKAGIQQRQIVPRKDNMEDLEGIQRMEEEVLAKRYAVMTKKANVMGSSPLAKEAVDGRVSASRSLEEEVRLQESRVDRNALEQAIIASKPKPVTPKLSTPSTPPSEARSRMKDVVYEPRLIGPVDELAIMTVEDFKRLGNSPDEIKNKIIARFEDLADVAPSKKIQGIVAWRRSPVYGVYRSMMQESLATGLSLAELSADRRNKGEESLTPDELKIFSELSQELQF